MTFTFAFNDLRKGRRSLVWHEQRASHLKNFALVSARKKSAGRNYSGFGFRTVLSAPNAAVRNTTRFVDGTRSSAAPASIKRPSRPGLPLTVWFWAIYLCATDKRGISTVQLSRTLNICHKSAWYLLHRIRAAMGQGDEKYVLSGIVQMDDGYVGGATHNGKRGRGMDKARIVVALSKTENGAALFTRMQVVEDVTSKTLQQVVGKAVAPGAKIECDGYRSYRNLSGVTLDAKKYETGYLHWLHKAISNLKALLLGTYHGRCTQLQAYLDEFCFRFNRRKTGNQIFMRLTRAVSTSCAQLR